MELEELKKSWNALDEHLKDKELIKEDELERLIGHADKGIHAIARLNIRLILISLPILILFLTEVILHNRLNPIYIIILLDSRSLLGYRHHAISSTDSNRRNASCGSDCPCQPHSSLDNQRTADCHRFPPDTCHSFFRLLADMAIRNRYDSVLHPVVGRRSYTHSMDLSQEIPEPYPRNQKEFK